MVCYVFLRPKGQTHAVDGSADHELYIVQDQRPVHLYGEGLLPLVELPPVHGGLRAGLITSA
jgi:hypothetical protein